MNKDSDDDWGVFDNDNHSVFFHIILRHNSVNFPARKSRTFLKANSRVLNTKNIGFARFLTC